MKKLLAALIVLVFLLSACKITGSNEQANNEEAPLLLTTMTHMESTFKDDVDEDLFWKHVDALRYAMDLADEYAAILTIETEKPFARANAIWGYNMMQEILERGHGVGTHCDIAGLSKNPTSTADLTEMFEENKKLVDDLVGAENNHGCSGGGSINDWLTAASQAGFDYINGIVGMHLLAIPQKNRPNADWDDKYIVNEAYHYNVPEDLADRIYFIHLKDLNDFEDDGDEGIMIISNGELGRLSMFAETQEEQSYSPRGGQLTKTDVDILIDTIKQVDQFRDKSRIAKLAIYIASDELTEENEDMLRYLFSETQKLQDAGLMQWSTQWDAVKTYIELEENK